MAIVLKVAEWLGVGTALAVLSVVSLPDAEVPDPAYLVFFLVLLGLWLAWIPFSLRKWRWHRGFLVTSAIVLVFPAVVVSHMMFDLTNVNLPPPRTGEEAIELVKKHELEGEEMTVEEAVERATPEGEEPRWEVIPVDGDEDMVDRWWIRVGSYQFRVTFLGGVRRGFFGG